MERWQILMKNITAPQAWIDFGFYFMIGASLQRRVFYYGSGEEGGELFLNPYYCFVGPPGLGKDLVNNVVRSMLTHHKYTKGAQIKTSTGLEYPPILSMGADSETFEELVESIAECVRIFPKPDGKNYLHCSYIFVLKELSSLFKRKTEDVVKFLIRAYDCDYYDYLTKHQGKQRLRNLCMSFLAGTQPKFLLEARKANIFDQGFASRTLWLFEDQKRFARFHVTELDEAQKKIKGELLLYLKQLLGLYGQIIYSEATYNFLESWERDTLEKETKMCSPRMQEYFARKKVTMLKLAGALHFAESTKMEIPTERFLEAIKILDNLEPQMEKGFSGAGRNEMHGYLRKIHDYIKSKGVAARRDIIVTFVADCEVAEIDQCLSDLESMAMVATAEEKGQKLYKCK